MGEEEQVGAVDARAKRMGGAAGTRPEPLPAGTEAPDFTLESAPGQKLSLRDFRGRPVVLAFYPADWSPVCGAQITLYNELRGEFDRYHAQVLGISVDGVWCHCAFARHNRVRLPLLADFEPKGAVARSYNAYRYSEGLAERALFVIDPEGKIVWSYLSPIGVNPGADGILEALDELDRREQLKTGTRRAPAAGQERRPGREALGQR